MRYRIVLEVEGSEKLAQWLGGDLSGADVVVETLGPGSSGDAREDTVGQVSQSGLIRCPIYGCTDSAPHIHDVPFSCDPAVTHSRIGPCVAYPF